METDNKMKVLFLCTGNSCRSQMGEAIVNARMGEEWQAYSAGVKPAGYVHPLAIQALEEIGIRHVGHSKSPEVFLSTRFDLVITVCDPAAESCPVWLRGGKVIHFPLEDPAGVLGSEEEQMTAFRSVRDQILRDLPDVMQDAVR
ncbi:MAG: arsenate reductase ArsC [Anaerolineaceae bacterium]